MPLLMEPDQTIEVWLEKDKDTPRDCRPIFIGRVQAARGQRKTYSLIDRWQDPNSGMTIDQLFDETAEHLSELLVGWKNQRVPYSPESIQDILTYAEMRELIRLIRDGQQLMEEEKKS